MLKAVLGAALVSAAQGGVVVTFGTEQGDVSKLGSCYVELRSPDGEVSRGARAHLVYDEEVYDAECVYLTRRDPVTSLMVTARVKRKPLFQ